MSRRDKLIAKLRFRPTGFRWKELESLLKHFGYQPIRPGKTAGSRRRFTHEERNSIISLHKPHPARTLKKYQIEQVIEFLEGEGLL